MQKTMTDGKKYRQKAREMFSAKNIARMAVFTAFAYLLYMPIFEFALIPAVPFLKVDFSNTFVMMAGFALGPVSGVIVGVLKELLHAVTFSQTVGVGELANILMMLPYVLIPAFAYRRRRKMKTVLITLPIACVAQAAWSVPVNYLLTFPFFLMAYAGAHDWATGMNFYLDVWYWAVLFNFVKTLLISAAVLLLYKQFQRIFAYVFSRDGAKQVKTDGDKTGVDTHKKYVTRSARQTEKLGEDLGVTLTGGEVILLTGELGAGKTVFCKGLAKGLGVTDDVVSPTFTIMNEHTGRLKFDHFDAYRLSGEDEAEGAGLSEFIGKQDTVCAVEWWENIAGMFDGCKTVKVDIQKSDGNAAHREVTITL